VTRLKPSKDIEGKVQEAIWQATISEAKPVSWQSETSSAQGEHAVEDAKG